MLHLLTNSMTAKDNAVARRRGMIPRSGIESRLQATLFSRKYLDTAIVDPLMITHRLTKE